MSGATRDARSPPGPFPRSFWTANATELLERAAYSAVVPFVVIYLGRLGLGRYWPSTLNSLLWGILYVLPVWTGAVADRSGFRRLLVVGFTLLGAGYALLGAAPALGGVVLADRATDEVTAPPGLWACVGAGILLVAVGGAVVKPCIAATVQKAGRARPAVAFGVLLTFVNLGSLAGRASAYIVRTRASLPAVFTMASFAVGLALAGVVVFYRGEGFESAAARGRGMWASLRETGHDIAGALRDKRLALLLLACTGFMFLTGQVYNLLPLYLENVLERKPPVDLYTLANPILIALFQLPVTRRFGRVRGAKSILVGTLLVGLAMAIHVIPLFVSGGPRALAFGLKPIGSVFVVASVAIVALGEMLSTARMYEMIGGLAPPGREALYLGCAGLPIALGYLTGGFAGAVLFHDVLCHGAVRLESGLLELRTPYAVLGWSLLVGIAVASAAGLWRYDVWSRARAATQR